MKGKNKTERSAVCSTWARGLRCTLLFASFLTPALSNAQEDDGPQIGDAELKVILGAGFSDNLTRTPGNEVEAVFGTIGLLADFTKDSRKTFFSLSSDVNYVGYDEPSIDSEPIGSIDAAFLFKFLSDTLTWNFEQSIGSVRSDLREVSRPDNREIVSVFRTGPSLLLTLGERTELSANYRLGSADYDVSDLNDSSTQGGSLQLSRQLSPGTWMGINIEARKVDYDEELIPDVDVSEASLVMAKAMAKGSIDLNVGWNELSRERQSDDISAFLYRLSWTHNVTSRSSFSLSASQEFSDSNELFRNGKLDNINIDRGEDVAAVSNPLERKTMGASFSSDKQRGSYAIAVTMAVDEYDGLTDLDNDSARIRFSATRQLRPRTEVEFGARYLRRDFDNQDREDIDLYGDAALRQRISDRIWIAFLYQFFDRDSNSDVNDASENRYGLTFTYEFLR